MHTRIDLPLLRDQSRRGESRQPQRRRPVAWARKRRLVAVLITVTMGSLVASAAQGDAGNPVVPKGGKVAGEGNAYFLRVQWQRYLGARKPGPPVCGTIEVHGQPVALLSGSGTFEESCNEPAGRPLYIVGVSNECSTLPGDHEGFGTSPEQLERCARAGLDGFSGSANVDGANVANYPELIAATPAFGIEVPKDNQFGIAPQTGRSAAYGETLLLRGLAAGTHAIRVNKITPADTFTARYTVHVK
jgi:hypothetical protein